MAADTEGPQVTARPVLSARGLVKHYGPTVALDGVDLDLLPGEVLGLIGANGAGKSTLIKVLSGAEDPTSGEIRVEGSVVTLHGPGAAAAHGIVTVHQDVDQSLVADLTVAENLVLGEVASGGLRGLSSPRRLRERAAALVGSTHAVDLDARVADLTTSAKQQVLIARALAVRPRVLILDEPTAALSLTEQRHLLGSVRSLTRQGTAVVFISHHMAEVVAVCDRVLALRDGRAVGTFRPPYRPRRLVSAILADLAVRPAGTQEPSPGRRPATSEGVRPAGDPGDSALELRGVRSRPHAAPLDLTVRRGEVVGITGLLGAGKTELLEQVVGARRLVDGAMSLRGAPHRPHDPAAAVSAGIGYVPEDRSGAAEIAEWDVMRNITLPDLRRMRRGGLLSRRAERAAAHLAIEHLSIVCSGPGAPLRSLSGGNRQKVVIGRWLSAQVRVLVLDEPFRGVDLGARADIARLLRDGGVDAALVASSDPEEILEVADRVLVMAGGTVVGEVLPGEVDAESLAELMIADVGRGSDVDRVSAPHPVRPADPAQAGRPEPDGVTG